MGSPALLAMPVSTASPASEDIRFQAPAVHHRLPAIPTPVARLAHWDTSSIQTLAVNALLLAVSAAVRMLSISASCAPAECI